MSSLCRRKADDRTSSVFLVTRPLMSAVISRAEKPQAPRVSIAMGANTKSPDLANSTYMYFSLFLFSAGAAAAASAAAVIVFCCHNVYFSLNIKLGYMKIHDGRLLNTKSSRCFQKKKKKKFPTYLPQFFRACYRKHKTFFWPKCFLPLSEF